MDKVLLTHNLIDTIDSIDMDHSMRQKIFVDIDLSGNFSSTPLDTSKYKIPLVFPIGYPKERKFTFVKDEYEARSEYEKYVIECAKYPGSGRMSKAKPYSYLHTYSCFENMMDIIDTNRIYISNNMKHYALTPLIDEYVKEQVNKYAILDGMYLSSSHLKNLFGYFPNMNI